MMTGNIYDRYKIVIGRCKMQKSSISVNQEVCGLGVIVILQLLQAVTTLLICSSVVHGHP